LKVGYIKHPLYIFDESVADLAFLELTSEEDMWQKLIDGRYLLRMYEGGEICHYQQKGGRRYWESIHGEIRDADDDKWVMANIDNITDTSILASDTGELEARLLEATTKRQVKPLNSGFGSRRDPR